MKRSEIRTLKDILDATGLIQADIANLAGVSKSLVSQVASCRYDNWELFVKQWTDILVAANKLVLEPEDGEEAQAVHAGPAPDADWKTITIDNSAFLRTDNVDKLYSLCDNLLDETVGLNASIGLATGRAGYGKTTAIRHYISLSDDVVYILWMNYTKPQLFQRIAEEFVGRSCTSYLKNVKLICELTRVYRKLIVIDEADRMPLSILEDLRTLNEEGQVPVLLLGEDSLLDKVKRADRIESRIRKPIVTFRALDWQDLAAYYQMAAGITLAQDVAKSLVRDAHRDFRVAANDMQQIVKLMNANHNSDLTMEVLDAIRRAR